jgi:hypothetical protein
MTVRRWVVELAAVAVLIVVVPVPAQATPVREARWRVRHGAHVALQYHDRHHTFHAFTARRALMLEPDLMWADDGYGLRGEVEITYKDDRKILLITRTPRRFRWFCTLTRGNGDIIASRSRSYAGLKRPQLCKGDQRWPS